MNMFRGILKTDEILPFPKGKYYQLIMDPIGPVALSPQQAQQLSEMIESFEKFAKV